MSRDIPADVQIMNQRSREVVAVLNASFDCLRDVKIFVKDNYSDLASVLVVSVAQNGGYYRRFIVNCCV